MKILELAILAVSAILLLTITLWKRKSPAKLRDIPALTRLFRTLGLSVEDGTRLHISLGRGSFLDSRGGSGLAGLAVLRYIAERTSVSDEPAVASAGDPALGLLAQDTLQAGYQAAGVEELYVPTTGRVTGLTPFGYAAGAMNISQNENVSTNIMLGHFGPEAALLAEASDRENITVIGASDDLAGQAVLFANTQDALIGEELFAAGAYLGAGASHTASLTVQDILRWTIIVALLGGGFAKLAGIF
ncbi:DUF6754 domain-containing protein [Candidatus Villigracilis affinis]|uniref:DUF6754 domain-containing protein n=1 Tax=Candidatus Villigracilis affinis TaxID=3140682 RepID=UPI002A1C5645|nr:hypothetical protein [Anaerolineales bacterium]